MPDVPLLSRAQMRRLEPLFPRSRGLPRVDDRRVISGIVYVIRHCLQWKDAPVGYGPAQDALQPLHPLEPSRRVRSHLRNPGRQGRRARTSDDRRHPPQGASHGGEPAAKGGPRHIGRTKSLPRT